MELQRTRLLLLLVIALPGTSNSQSRANDALPRPNIVLLLADDLGYADVGFHDSDIRTPNLDRLAADGVRLERFYVAPVCSPTRAGLMTGRWPIRFGLQHAVIPPWRDRGLPPVEVTIAEMLAGAGYLHRACIGKWHLGHARREHLPRAHGFTHFYGHYNGAIDYFTHKREGQTDWHRNAKTMHEDGYSTDLLGAEAVRFIRNVPRAEPYFLYVPFNAPHAPLQAKPEDIAKYRHRRGRKRTYAAMVDSMDQAIGRILTAIDQRGDADNTFVLFLSDNGGTPVADNGALRGRKATLYEGGIRSPAIARWRRAGISGGRACTARMGYIDILPTLRAAAHLTGDFQRPLDGVDVLPALRTDAPLPDRPWFNYFSQNANEAPRWSVQNSRWKLIYTGSPTSEGRFSEEARIELFPVVAGEPQESTSVATKHSKVVRQLLDRLAEFHDLANGKPLAPYDVGRQGFRAPKDWMVAE